MLENHLHSLSPNAARFYEALHGELSKADHKQTVTLIFIKFDCGEKISENCENLTTARALRRIKNLISNNIRRDNPGFIYDSEELMIILPGTPKNDAVHVALRLRQLIETFPFTNESGARVTLKSKLGMATYPYD